MAGYYAQRLSGERLRRCYEVASPRMQQYLEAEILHASSRLRPTDWVLELGCGYGRIARRLARAARTVIGIDNAPESLGLARRMVEPGERCEYLCMDALALGFSNQAFDAVLCLQNGICAFGVPPSSLLMEALRVTRAGGRLIFSTYSDEIWEDRLEWFETQAAEGLLGAIDRSATRDGVIVCQDGFRAGRLTRQEMLSLSAQVGQTPNIVEVDESSVFLELTRPADATQG